MIPKLAPSSVVSKWVSLPAYKWSILWVHNPLTNHLRTSNGTSKWKLWNLLFILVQPT